MSKMLFECSFRVIYDRLTVLVFIISFFYFNVKQKNIYMDNVCYLKIEIKRVQHNEIKK